MKKNISLALIFAIMLSSIFSTSVKAEKFSDMPENWARVPIEKAISNGLLQGNNGKINAQGNLTRAELVTILNRALGIQAKGSLDSFSDVDSSKWYHDELAKGVQAKLIQGSNGKLNPENDITRQETFVIVARALEIYGDTNEHLGFKDGETLPNWAMKEVNGLIKNGYLKGNDGKINPKGKITRAEFASLMNELIGEYVASSGTYDKNINGNLLVKSPNVELKGIKINGDLILAEGVLTNKTILNGVEVTGRVLVRGGGEIFLENGSKVNDVVVVNNLGRTSIDVDKTSQVARVDLKTKADIKGEGKVVSVYVGNDAQNSVIATKDTKIDNGKNIEIKPIEKKDDKKEKSSSGGGGGGGSSSGGNNSDNDKDDDKPVTPKPDDSKVTIKPDSNGNAVVRGNNLKEIILDGDFKNVTIDAPNAKVIVRESSKVGTILIENIKEENLEVAGKVDRIDVSSIKPFTVKFVGGESNSVEIVKPEGPIPIEITIEAKDSKFVIGKNMPNSNVKIVNGKIENIGVIDGEQSFALTFNVVDMNNNKIEDVKLNLTFYNKDTGKHEIFMGIANEAINAGRGSYSYTIIAPGYQGVGMTGIVEMDGTNSIELTIELMKLPEITDRDRAINDINLGLDIINQMIEIDKSLIMGGKK